MTAADIRAANLDSRNRKIREAFYQRYTNVPRASKPDRQAVVEQLAADYFLSAKTIDKVLLSQ